MAIELSPAQVRHVRALWASGMKFRDIERKTGWPTEVVVPNVLVERTNRNLGRTGRRPPPPWWAPRPGRLSLAEREEISRGLAAGLTYSAIASSLRRAVSTVSREVAAGGGRRRYRAQAGHLRAYEAARRPKPFKLANPVLAKKVEAGLRNWWAPTQISARLRNEHPDDPMMRVSHETIYQALFVQGRGELRRELHRCLRSGRAARRVHNHSDKRKGRPPGMVMISERPAEVADRAVPGHWEGDLILGKDAKTAVGTLVERASRYVMLLHLPTGRGADAVEEAMKAAICRLPAELVAAGQEASRATGLFKSITWDQGSEMANHLRFSVDTGVQIYFCDPAKPWQRGTNENTNGLLRQYMPKGTDLSRHSAADLAEFAHSLNGRPRQTLDWMTPFEKLTQFLALTA